MLAKATPATHRALLTSTPVLTEAAQDVPRYWLDQMGVSPAHYLRKILKVSVADREGIVTVQLTGPEPKDTADVLNKIIAAYKTQLHDGLEAQDSAQPVAAATQAAESPEQVGRGSKENLPSEQTIAQQLHKLSSELAAARMRKHRLAQLLEQARAEPLTVTNLLPLLAAADPGAERRQWLDVRELEAQDQAIQHSLAAYGDRLGTHHRIIESLKRQAATVKAEIEARQKQAAEQMLAHLNQLEVEASARAADLTDALARWQLRAVMMRAVVMPVAEIEPAMPATKPSSPRPVRVMAISGAGGLLLGALLALAMDLLFSGTSADPIGHDLLCSSDDVDFQDDGMPLYGTVPRISAVDAADPINDATAMSMHQIRALLQVRAKADGSRAFAVTSPSRGDGKTSVAVGLAASLGLSGTRTLLIDCDLTGRMNRQKIARHGGPPPAVRDLDAVLREMGYVSDTALRQAQQMAGPLGIAGVLEGALVAHCVVDTGVPNLSILPAAAIEQQHVGQLSGKFIRSLIDQCTRDYELVPLDTGPVPGGAEPLLVASEVDGVILVATHGESRSRFAKALSYLRLVEARIVGTVFNRAETKDEPHTPEPRGRRFKGSREEIYGSGLLAMAVCGQVDTDPQVSNNEPMSRAQRSNLGTTSPPTDGDVLERGPASAEEVVAGLTSSGLDDDPTSCGAADAGESGPSFFARLSRRVRGLDPE